MSTRIIVASRYRLFSECLAGALSKLNGLRATPVSEQLPEAKKRILAETPDVLLVDLHHAPVEMLELMAAVTGEGQKVLVVGVGNGERAEAADAAGALGSAWLETSLAELVGMIGKVRKGERVVPGQGEE